MNRSQSNFKVDKSLSKQKLNAAGSTDLLLSRTVHNTSVVKDADEVAWPICMKLFYLEMEMYSCKRASLQHKGSCRAPSGSEQSSKGSFISVTINNDRYDVSKQVVLERKVSAAKAPTDVHRNVKCGTASKEKHSESSRPTKSPGNKRHDDYRQSRDSSHRSDRNTSWQSSRDEVRGHDASRERDSKNEGKVDVQRTNGRRLPSLSKSAENSRHSSDKSFSDKPGQLRHHHHRESPRSGRRANSPVKRSTETSSTQPSQQAVSRQTSRREVVLSGTSESKLHKETGSPLRPKCSSESASNCGLKVVVTKCNTVTKDPTADLSSAENLVVVVSNDRLHAEGVAQSPGLDSVKKRLSLKETVDVGNAAAAAKSEVQASAGEKITLKFRSATAAASESPARNESNKPTEQAAAPISSNSSIADLLKAIGFNFELCKQTLQKVHTLPSVTICDGDGIAGGTAALAREETCAREVHAGAIGISESNVPQANGVPFAYSQSSADQKIRPFSSLVDNSSFLRNNFFPSSCCSESRSSVEPAAQLGRELPKSSPLSGLADFTTDAVAPGFKVQLDFSSAESRSAAVAAIGRERRDQYCRPADTEGLSLPAACDAQKSVKLDRRESLSPLGQRSDCSRRPKPYHVTQEKTRQRSRSPQRFASNRSPAVRMSKDYWSRSRSRERPSIVSRYSRSRSRSRSRCSRSRSISPLYSMRGRRAPPVRLRSRPPGGERGFGRGLSGPTGRGFQWSRAKLTTSLRGLRLQPRAPAARSMAISRGFAHHRQDSSPSRDDWFCGKRGHSPTGFASSKFLKTSARERSPSEQLHFLPSGRGQQTWKGSYPRNAPASSRPSVPPGSYNDGRDDEDDLAALKPGVHDPWLRSTEEFLIKLHKRNHEDSVSMAIRGDDAERSTGDDDSELEMKRSKGTGSKPHDGASVMSFDKHAKRFESQTSLPGSETTASSDKKSKKHHKKKKKKKKKHEKDRLQVDLETKSSKKSDESRSNQQNEINADSVDTAPKLTMTDKEGSTVELPSAAALSVLRPLPVLVSQRTSTNADWNTGSIIASNFRGESSLVTNLPSGESADRVALLSTTVVGIGKTPDGGSHGYPTCRVTNIGKDQPVRVVGNGGFRGADVIKGLPLSSHQEKDYNDAKVTLNGLSTVTSSIRSAAGIQVEDVSRLAVSSSLEPQLDAKSSFASSSHE